MLTTEYTVWCDNEDCGEWYQVTHMSSKSKAVKQFKRQGWKFIKTTGQNGIECKWLCPNCMSK